MVSIETINAANMDFINEWLINGHNAGKAYKKAYPNSTSGQDQSASALLSIPKIKAEIQRRQVKLRAKNGRTIAELDIMYETGFDIAVKTNNPAGIAINTTGIARLYGMDKDSGVNSDEQRILTESNRLQIKKIAEQLVLNANKRKFVESKEIDNEVS